MPRRKLRLILPAVTLPVLIGLYSLWAQEDLQITDIHADSVTKSSARIGFHTTKPGQYGIVYGVDERYGFQSALFRATKAGVIVITGLPPDRDIHYRVCYSPGNNAQLLCASDRVTHTAPATVPGVELAAEPKTFETPMPTVNGETFLVNEACTNLQQQLANAARADGNQNHAVLIPAGAACYGNFQYSPKRGANPNGDGVIVVRTAATDAELPPEGMRISPAWETAMARIVNNAIFTNNGAALPTACTPEEFYWLTTAKKYHICLEKNTWTPLDSLSDYSAGSNLPATCTAGQFFTIQATNRDGLHDLQRCIRENTWIPVTPRGDGGRAMANTASQAVRGYRFVGLIFETAEPNGINYSGLLDIGNYSSKHENIVVDRCIFRVPPKGSSPSAIGLNGSFVAVVNSWFDMRVAPTLHPHNPVANSFLINIGGGKGPFRINNNYVRGSGFLLFVNDNNHVLLPEDIDVRRNTFTYNDDFRCGSPTSDNICRDVRGPIELKRGRRVLFDGNIVENFWSTLSGGQAFIITPRASGSTGPDTNDYQIADLTIRYNIVRDGTGFAQITGQDDVGYRNTKITQRVTITHNLITGIDAYKRADKKHGSNRGQVLAIAFGVEDLTFRHNSVINNRGSGPSFLHGSWAAISGLDFRDNILWVNKAEVGRGLGIRWSEPAALPNGTLAARANEQAILNGMALSIPNTSYEFRNNAFVAGPGVKMSDLKSNYPNAAANQFLEQKDENEEIVGFENFPTNFRLNVSSKLKSFASDGTDPGVDMDELERRLGQIRAQWIDGVTTDSATIVFYPPDAYACLLQVSEDNTFRNSTGVRDESSGDRRLITITGLQPGKHYFYRLGCASSTLTGEFDTLGSAQ